MLERIGISIPEELLSAFDEYIKKHKYEARSEAVRDMIRQTLLNERVEQDDENAIGVLVIIYDHEKRDISSKLIHHQHEHVNFILSTLHIHLDKHNCLELIVLKGLIKDINEIADEIISSKGVVFGQLVKSGI
ncbi:MAG: nickel-responsive transcriptional regulator NikR [Candidatus Coatesbacteria bacterium]|nr:nickel-responsive transcriptional regulator NikR [Candidatus Coatesbacteria bacterium]